MRERIRGRWPKMSVQYGFVGIMSSCPHRVECDDGYPGYCKVVNGAPFRGEIVGFQPRHDYSYRLRVERFGMFPDGMTGSPPFLPAYGYRRLETLERTPSD